MASRTFSRPARVTPCRSTLRARNPGGVSARTLARATQIDMKGTGFATLVAAVAMTAGLAPAIDQQHAAAVVLPATSVASPSGKVRVTVVEGRANAPLALSVRALVVQPGALASWVTLPLTEIPRD